MSGYEVVEARPGMNLSMVADWLEEYNAEGTRVKVEFNGEWLYSDVDSVDDMYIKVIGKTQAEHKEYLAEMSRDYHRREAEHKERLPYLEDYYMEKGHRILPEDKWDYWDEIVPVRLRDLYKGLALDGCLDIALILKSGGSLDAAKEALYSQGHSGTSGALTISMIKEFSPRGEEFADYVS